MTSLLPFPDSKQPGSSPDQRPGRARKGRLFLLDGTALAYRSHFAMIRQPLLTSTGQNVSALFVFANTLFRILENEHPDYLAVGFDPKGKTFRHDMYEPYKATREKTPDELVEIFPALRELVEAFAAPIVEVPGFEADDVIATLAVAAEKAGHEVFIVTGDKDFLQIVSPRIQLYNILRADTDVTIQGEKETLEKFGVGPDRVVDVLALMGDSSDNVPGVAGIGPKTAAKLISEFGSVEQLYERLNDVSQAGVRQKLSQDRDMAFLSKRLVTLDLEAPVSFDEAAFRYSGPDAEKLMPLFKKYEIHSLMRRVSVDQAHDEHHYHLVDNQKTWVEFLDRLETAKSFVFDTETTSVHAMIADLVGISISFQEREAYYLPMNLDPPLFQSKGGDQVQFLKALRGPFADPAVKKRAQNAKYDLLVLERAGLTVDGIDFDTMIASYCVSPGEFRHNLDSLALKYLNFQKVPTSALLGTGRAQVTMDQVDVAKVSDYAGEDADITGRLIPLLTKEMEEAGVAELFRTVEMPLLRVLADMERRGVSIDLELLSAISIDLGQRLLELERAIHELAGEEFNINSPRQLGPILFEKQEIHKQFGTKKPRRTKTGYSTNAAVLESLKGHPLPEKILAYRALGKLKSTYVDALPELVHPETGRIHTSYNQTVAATGRLSSSDPNLQNIPIRTEEGQKIRRAFIPEKSSNSLLAADYSQVELRIMAHLSADEQLCHAFRAGADVHRWTAGQIFGMAAEEVPPELRARAKTINFGVIYGMGPQRLAAQTGLTTKEAAKFIEAYFETFSGVKQFLDRTLEEAAAKGYVTTLLGRRRYITELDSKHPRVAAAARNVAVNTPIQGSAADLIKVAMIQLHERLLKEKVHACMIMQVHDELVLEVPDRELQQVETMVVEVMAGALKLSVPLVVDVGIGKNWLEAHSA